MSAGLVPDEAAPPGRRWSRQRLGPRSLTARLVVGVVSLVAVLVALIGGGTWLSLRYFLGQRLDQQLLATTTGAQIDNLFQGRSQPNPGVRAPQDVWAVALTPDGAVIAYPHNHLVEGMELGPAARAMLARRTSPDPVTITTRDGVQLRVITRPATAVATVTGTSEAAVAVIGLSTAEEHRTLDRLVNLELIIGTAAVVVALLATTYGVRFSLRRLRQVTATANEVAAELSPTGRGLERRVEVDDAETEVGQLAQSMNTLLAAVETQFAARLESEARLRQFLADASHELRTPLTSIRGYAELARMQKAAGESHDDNLARIESEGTRMSRLVEDLLMLARGDGSRSPALELIDVAELVDDAAAGTRAAFAERRVETRLAPGLHVVGDRDDLLRAVRNLLTNAAVHTDPSRPILATCGADGDRVVIQVIDGGPGLPPEEAAQVFERFWRADKARTRARGGSGLGMSIVAAIVAAHGGTVHFASSVEHGSTATITLPAVD